MLRPVSEPLVVVEDQPRACVLATKPCQHDLTGPKVDLPDQIVGTSPPFASTVTLLMATAQVHLHRHDNQPYELSAKQQALS